MSSRLIKLVRWIKVWLKERLILTVGITVGIASLLSTGPLLQEAFIAFFDVTKESLYESLVPGGIALDKGPKVWILATFEPRWLVTASIIALIAVHMSGWRRMVIATGVAATGGLTVLDVVYGIINEQITTENMLVNIAGNVLGGLAISVFFFLVLWVSLMVRRAVLSNQNYRNILTAAIAASFGFSVSIILYIVMATLLQPVEIKARILAKPPIEGVIGKAHPKEDDSGEQQRFRFIGERAELDRVVLSRTKGLEWEWVRTDKDTHFDVTVYVVGGCSTLDQVQEIVHGSPIVEYSDIVQMGISAEGLVDRSVIDGMQIGTTVERTEVSQFWIDKNDAGGGLDLTEFLTSEQTVLSKTSGDLALLVTIATFQHVDESTIHLSPRTIDLYINDEIMSIVFEPKSSLDDEEGLSCVNLQEKSSTTIERTYENVVLGGFYAEIERSIVPQRYFVHSDGHYTFKQPNGWFRRLDVPHDSLSAMAAKEFGMIVLEEPIHELFVNGESYEIPTGAGFRGHGKMRASYDKAHGVSVSGTFHAAWLEQQRLNLTRWEGWTFEKKFAIITAIASIVIWTASLIYRTRNIWRTLDMT